MYSHGGVGLRQVRFDGTLLSDLSRNINNIVRILCIRTFLKSVRPRIGGRSAWFGRSWYKSGGGVSRLQLLTTKDQKLRADLLGYILVAVEQVRNLWLQPVNGMYHAQVTKRCHSNPWVPGRSTWN